MSEFTKDLMRQLRFISSASNAFMSKRQKLTGQQRVLAILVKEDGLIQSQLAEILDIRPSSLAELMKKMEKTVMSYVKKPSMTNGSNASF